MPTRRQQTSSARPSADAMRIARSGATRGRPAVVVRDSIEFVGRTVKAIVEVGKDSICVTIKIPSSRKDITATILARLESTAIQKHRNRLKSVPSKKRASIKLARPIAQSKIPRREIRQAMKSFYDEVG